MLMPGHEIGYVKRLRTVIARGPALTRRRACKPECLSTGILRRLKFRHQGVAISRDCFAPITMTVTSPCKLSNTPDNKYAIDKKPQLIGEINQRWDLNRLSPASSRFSWLILTKCQGMEKNRNYSVKMEKSRAKKEIVVSQ